ncbi:MAG TPA: VWA domain-containing protein [Terriglobia bacterium]|nr:VWA domain-containing protein [Terriglobia bacterium]
MKKLLLSITCLLLAFTSKAQEPTQGSEPPRPTASLRVDVNLVELHVSVMDGSGRPVGGLRQEHFKVTENNITQPITIFKHEDIPVSLGLVVDNSRSIEPRKGRLDAAALSFVANSNPDDETFIVHFDFDARVSQEFTDNRALLSRKLSEAKPFGQTAIFDGLLLALDTMDNARYQKKALLLITDGIDNASKATLAQVLEKVKREHVMVFPIGLLSESGGVAAEDALLAIAKASGGRAYFPNTPEDARAMMDIIARDLREQYTLAYLPSNVLRNGTWRSVRVDITPPKGYPSGLSTIYRHGYYAPDEQ